MDDSERDKFYSAPVPSPAEDDEYELDIEAPGRSRRGTSSTSGTRFAATAD